MAFNVCWHMPEDPDVRLKVTKISDSRVFFDYIVNKNGYWQKTRSGSSDKAYWEYQINKGYMQEVEHDTY